MNINNSPHYKLTIMKDEHFAFSKCNFTTIFSEIDKIIIPDFKLQIINQLIGKYEVTIPNEEIIINYQIRQIKLSKENNSNDNAIVIEFEFQLKTKGKLVFDFFNLKTFSFPFQPLAAFDLNAIKKRNFNYSIPVHGNFSRQLEKISDLAQEQIFTQLIGEIKEEKRIDSLFQNFSFLEITYQIFETNINIAPITVADILTQPINEKVKVTINALPNCKWLTGKVTFIFNVKGDPNIYNFLSTVLTKKFLVFTTDKGNIPFIHNDHYFGMREMINNFYKLYKNEGTKKITNTPNHALLDNYLTSIIKEHLNVVKNKNSFDEFAVKMIERWLKCAVVNNNNHFGTFGYQYFTETNSKEYYFSFNQIKAGPSLLWAEYYLFNNVTFLFRP